MKFLLYACILIANANTPFWKQKEAVYQRIVEDRAIIVSANITSENEQKHLAIVSAGHIKTPLKFTWKKLLDFKHYDQITDHFKDVDYNPKKQELFINVGALGYYAGLWLKLNPSEGSAKNTLAWKCYRGAFKGMNGTLTIEKYGIKVTEISMQADFTGKSVPIPDILLRFGLELIGKQMASKMRNYIEDSYKNDTSVD
ncbi:MAG: hypothetical protein KDD37_01295 [Bdellovibrionales bacterium]|nr:hypothetical protein [Bdellovibrionales bacterium]